jgi:hypothetical protein
MKEDEEANDSERPAEDNQTEAANKYAASTIVGRSEGVITEEKPADRKETPESTSDKAEPIRMRLLRIWIWVKDPKHSSAMVAIFTAVIMLTGISYTIFAALQWSAIRESNQINRESLTSVQRAFVVLQGTQDFTFLNRDKRGEHVVFRFFSHLQNSGATPAKGVQQMFTGDKLPNEPTEAQFIQGAYSKAYIVGPKADYAFGNVMEPLSVLLPNAPMTIAAIQSVTYTGPRFTFWGWFSYRDIFPKTPIHVTEWCQIMVDIAGRPNTEGFGPNIAWQFNFENCEHHNCADDDCPDHAQIVALHNPRY